MACFLVPAAEAVVTTIANKVMKSKEAKETSVNTENVHEEGYSVESKIKFTTKLGWLNKLLWGGSALLAFEHLWHGEVVPFFPFLTAVQEGQEATAEMLSEMGTVGVTMAVLVTAIWGGMVAVSSVISKRKTKETNESEA